MNNLLSPAIFYLFVLISIFCIQRKGGFKILIAQSEILKYHIGTTVYFFLNINILFFCTLTTHNYEICIPFTLLAVLIGAAVYLSHLGKQTVHAIRQIFSGTEFDLIAPFLSIPYFFLINDIIYAIFNSGLESLHAYESKMLIVLLYPFFITVGELMSRIRKAKSDSENNK